MKRSSRWSITPITEQVEAVLRRGIKRPNLKTLSLVSQWGREHAGAATGKFAFDGGKLRDGLKCI